MQAKHTALLAALLSGLNYLKSKTTKTSLYSHRAVETYIV